MKIIYLIFEFNLWMYNLLVQMFFKKSFSKKTFTKYVYSKIKNYIRKYKNDTNLIWSKNKVCLRNKKNLFDI